MNNFRIDPRTAKDIDRQIDRVHAEFGYKEGKVKLPLVRDLLRLDLQYYRLEDPKILDEVVHKLKVGAKQIIERPVLLLEAVKKFDLSALFVPDRKRILIDDAVPDLKKRWIESHEIAHSLIPWHANYMLGDNKATLSQSCHLVIESEANYGAGRLLFPHGAFHQACRSATISITLVRQLAAHFGNTITSTLWRCVEQSDDLVFAAIGEHPRHSREGKPLIEYLIRSARFEQQFPNIREEDVWGWLLTFCSYRQTGPLGECEIVVPDMNGSLHVFYIESFSIKHNVLTLARWVRHRPLQVIVSVAVEANTESARLP